MNSFIIDKSSKIVLYGVSSIRPNIMHDMRNEGYNIIAYFDIRADELNGMLDVPVYTIENAPYTILEKSEICIIICLQNAIQHEKVARALFKNGYYKILFLPTDPNIKESYAKKLREQFRYFYHNDFLKINQIPYYNSIFYDRFDENRCIVSQNYDLVTVWLPIDILYTGIEKDNVYSDLNISSHTNYLNLFKSFSDGSYDYKAYIDFMKSFKETNVNDFFISHRIELYNLFNNELNKGTDFFIDSAPLAVWNSRGYFNLTDGHHRTIFLLTRGFRLFPCSISKDDFEMWLNIKKIQPIKKYLKNLDTDDSIFSIPHPTFLFERKSRTNNEYDILYSIGEYLSSCSLTDISILDTGAYNCFFSRFFARSTNNNVVYIEHNEELRNFIVKVNDLLHLENIKVMDYEYEKLSNLGEFHFTIVLNTFYNFYESDNAFDIIKQLDKCTKKMMFWESGKSIEEEKSFIINNSKFKYYTPIRKRIVGNKLREIGVFKKEEF